MNTVPISQRELRTTAVSHLAEVPMAVSYWKSRGPNPSLMLFRILSAAYMVPHAVPHTVPYTVPYTVPHTVPYTVPRTAPHLCPSEGSLRVLNTNSGVLLEN